MLHYSQHPSSPVNTFVSRCHWVVWLSSSGLPNHFYIWHYHICIHYSLYHHIMGCKEPKCREKEGGGRESMKIHTPLLNCTYLSLFSLLKKVGKLQSSSVISCYYWIQNILLFLGSNLPYSCSYDRGISGFSILNNFWCLGQATC